MDLKTTKSPEEYSSGALESQILNAIPLDDEESATISSIPCDAASLLSKPPSSHMYSDQGNLFTFLTLLEEFPVRDLEWHGADHTKTRETMRICVSRLIHQRRPQADSNWIGKLNNVARLVEQKLYFSALSFEEYSDPRSVIKRLQILVASLVEEARNKVIAVHPRDPLPLDISHRLPRTIPDTESSHQDDGSAMESSFASPTIQGT